MSTSKLPMRFELIIPTGNEPLDDVRMDDLRRSVKARERRLARLTFDGRVDLAELLHRYPRIRSIPVIELVTVHVGGKVTVEEMRAHIEAALIEDLYRQDIDVVGRMSDADIAAARDRRGPVLPPPRTCAKRALDAAINAGRLREVAEAAANLGHFGAAVALEVLALEEAAKARALRLAATLPITARGPIDAESAEEVTQLLTALVEDVLRRDHSIRHWFAQFELHVRETERLRHNEAFRDFSERVRAAEAALEDKVRWLDRADDLKLQGLYVEPHNGSTPSKLNRSDYEEAVAVVEPFVAATLAQVRTLPAAARRQRRP